MSIIVDDRLRSVALTLVDERSRRVETAGLKSCADFFDGRRTLGSWEFSIEALGDLAELRHRLSEGIPLDGECRTILTNLTEAPSDFVGVPALRQFLADE